MSGLAWRLRLRRVARTIGVLATLGSVAILLGCGGGGGENNPIPTGTCGLPEGTTTPAICGTVVDANSGGLIEGATVTLENASGGPVAGVSPATTDALGFFVFANVPASMAGVAVEDSTGYVPHYVRYKDEVWDVSKGPITVAMPAAPTEITDKFGLYSTNSPPPPPATRP
jgi:hypothetical protein